MWKQLLTISAEDCWSILTQEVKALHDSYLVINKGVPPKQARGRIFISKAVTLLCLSKKRRDPDHLQNMVYHQSAGLDADTLAQELRSSGEYLAIPGYAYDCHTREAKCVDQCGRGMINFKKAFRRDARGRYVGVVEFRVFAGTTSIDKILHHLGSVLGLSRRAHEVRCLGGFGKNKMQQERTATAKDTLRFLWDYLGWTGGARPVALGLFGKLHSGFCHYRKNAQRLCEQFDERYPDASLCPPHPFARAIRRLRMARRRPCALAEEPERGAACRAAQEAGG